LIRKSFLLIIAIYASTFLFTEPTAGALDDYNGNKDKKSSQVVFVAPPNTVKKPAKTTVKPVVFTHGDVSWLPELAAKAGWKPEHMKKLGQIILRESGGCPNRIGSSIVDKNCNVTGYTKATNKSDTGLLQINGVNYNPARNKWAIACKKMNICTQEPLLDPITNLKVGKLLFDEAGWEPWNVCNWNPKAKGCK
jgi:hypothetical protein